MAAGTAAACKKSEANLRCEFEGCNESFTLKRNKDAHMRNFTH